MQLLDVRKMAYVFKYRSAIFLLIALGMGCATPVARPVQLTMQEQLNYDHAASRGWAAEIEGQLEIVHDIEVDVALRQFAGKLVALRPALAAAPIGVLVFKNSDSRLPPVFSIPGNRIYVSRELLKSFTFENELTAALAVECGHLLGRHAIARASPVSSVKEGTLEPAVGSKVDFFSPAGVFAFPISQHLEATREASRILYEAGYDPRGLVSYLRKLQTQRVGLESGALVHMENAARDEISHVPPLRNPVVRTEAFLRVQGRIRKL